MPFSSIQLVANNKISVFFMTNISLCVLTKIIFCNPSICRWEARQISYIDYCEWHHSKHGYADVSFVCWHHFLWMYSSKCAGANLAIFLGFTVCLEFAWNSLLWGHKQLSAGSKVSQTFSEALQGFLWLWPHSVGGVRKNSVTNLFFCSWLVFLTTCEPSTAKLPWLHKPLGVYNSFPDTDQGSGLWEFICPESASIIKFLLSAEWFSDCFPHRFPHQVY
jgi:hypothetical protein